MVSGADRDINGSALPPAKAVPAPESGRPRRSSACRRAGERSPAWQRPRKQHPVPACSTRDFPGELALFRIFFPRLSGVPAVPQTQRPPHMVARWMDQQDPGRRLAQFGSNMMLQKSTGVGAAVVRASKPHLG